MPSVRLPHFANLSRVLPPRRAIAFVLALAVHLLIILLLLYQVQTRSKPVPPPPLVTFNVLPDRGEKTATAKAEVKRDSGAKAKTQPKRPVTKVDVTVPPPKMPVPPLNMVIISRETFAAGDISKIPSRSGSAGQGATGEGSGKDSGSTYGPGDGPGGERLYNADWRRRPTQAELSFYIPPNAPKTGWGMIACQTADDYQVENCRELGESPRGSGLARAVRQSAWQFRVTPPRMGGRPMIGAWVRIRIDYTQGVAKER